MSTELASTPSIDPTAETDNPVASFLSPSDRQEEINAQIAAEGGVVDKGALDSETASDLTTGPTRESFRYDAAVRMDGTPLVLQQVLNNEKTLDELSDREVDRMNQELDTVETFQSALSSAVGNNITESPVAMQSTLSMVLKGELAIGDADRTALRNISLQLGNLYAIPSTLANGLRDWTMNENRDMNGGPLQQAVAENFAARQAESSRVNISDKVIQNGGNNGPEDLVMSREDIDKAMTEGPNTAQYRPMDMAM